MKFGHPITRLPRAFDPEIACDALASLSFEGDAKELLAGAAGCSPYLAGLIDNEAAWLQDAAPDMQGAVDAEITALNDADTSDLNSLLRRAKRRVALATALADLSGAWSLQQVTGVLTRLAEMACQTALRHAIQNQIRRGKLPGLTEADVDDAGGMVVLAMGKMGAAELNYSSDIDLICLFDETRFDASDYHDVRSGFVKATRQMAQTLGDITAEGYVFRTDLRLRPDPSVTPVCIAMGAAEHYYESLGRTWERAAFIKARAVAGDFVGGDKFLRTLDPFVWRRHLDFAAIQDAHDMRLAIRQHKALGGPITLPDHNMKLGRGGIREIEFFTQTRQLIAGGRDPDLRCRGTLEGLDRLGRKGWVSTDAVATLSEHYTAHRTVEHRLQMVRDAQTHSLPKTEEGFERLAAMMDTDVASLQAGLHKRLAEVHQITEGFFAPGATPEVSQVSNVDEGIMNRWVTYPALRSARSRELFERVKPDLLSRLSKTQNPDSALLAIDGFLSGLPAGVQLFSLLQANPHLTDLIIDITGTSSGLARYLSRNASVFDAVIGGDFFSAWPGSEALGQSLENTLSHDTDYERQLDATRRWYKEWHFRIGVHLLRGLITPREARSQYSDLARAVVATLWPLVTEQFGMKYGPPPGRGAVVLGMGSLGARVLSATSDLDLIVIYDPLKQEMSEGKKQISSRLYYARLTQSLITALSAPMAEGKLFEVDMRLRPSGNQGPVATSWGSFQSYQTNEAWVWEHLALTRAEVVAGPEGLAGDVAAFLTQTTARPRDVAEVLQHVVEMRRRIRQAKAPASLFDTKVGPGRLQEIELFAQTGALLSAAPCADTAAGVQAAADMGLIPADEARVLQQTAALLYDFHTVARLLSPDPIEPKTLGAGAQHFLLRTLHKKDMAAFEQELADRYARASEILDTALAAYDSEGGST